MIRDESRSSQSVTQAPLPSGAHPYSSSPTAPRNFPVARSTRERYGAWFTWNSTQMPLNGATKRSRPTPCACRLPPIGDAPEGFLPPRPAGFAPLCNALHQFAVIFRPGHNYSPPKTSASGYQQLGLIPGPKLCRSVLPFRSSAGPVMAYFPATVRPGSAGAVNPKSR
jgi:hypothetical protein